jgi:uncharacterized protein
VARGGRDRLFAEHPHSPLAAADPLRAGLRYAPYDPRLRWELGVEDDGADERLTLVTGPGESTHLRRLGRLRLPEPVGAPVAAWWLEQ